MKTEKRTCRICNRPFEISIPDGEAGLLLAAFKPNICGGCAPALEVGQAREREAREKQERDEARLNFWNAAVPPLYRATDPALLPPASLPAVAAAAAWTFGPHGLGFIGDTRRGKTRVVYLLLHRLLFDHGRRFVALTTAEFSHRVSRLAADDLAGLDAYLAKLCKTSVLFFDDLGKGRMTERVEAEFFHVVETRTAHLRPILFTANATGEALAAAMSEDRGPAIIARLREACDVLALA